VGNEPSPHQKSAVHSSRTLLHDEIQTCWRKELAEVLRIRLPQNCFAKPSPYLEFSIRIVLEKSSDFVQETQPTRATLKTRQNNDILTK
jgi:hypothetical protein